MNGYTCNGCGNLIATTKRFERRDCPTCGCRAEFNHPDTRARTIAACADLDEREGVA